MTLISWDGVKGYNTTDIMIRIVIRTMVMNFTTAKAAWVEALSTFWLDTRN